MPTKRQKELMRLWPSGAQAPTDYFSWHEWAEAQHMHGLRQDNCLQCGRYCFPQQMNNGVCIDRNDCEASVKKHGKLKLAKVRASQAG